MSALYNLEPQPTAKVLLTTTSGDILLELFAKQTPLASRSFLQHCLNGYYNNTIFHRLVSGFILQGGDPTSTGHGGESAFPKGEPFEDEFHSRLKFNRRGLLGMANDGLGKNGSQFFLTLGETRELQDKHTMFGRIMGDTIYNLMKMGEAELDGNSERPIYPTKITVTEILVNPFEDMVKSEPKKRAEVVETGMAKKKGKKKGGKTLLSFTGDEAEEGDTELRPLKEKFNPELISADSATNATGGNESALKVVEKTEDIASEQLRQKKIRRRSTRWTSPPIMMPNREMQLPLPKDEEPSQSPSSSPEPEQIAKVTTTLDRTNAQIAEMKTSMKRNISTAPSEKARKKSTLEQMMPENSMRGRKRKHNGDAPVDKQSLDTLAAFRAKLESAPPEIKPAKEPALQESSKHNRVNGQDKGTANVGDEDDEAALCDLHFVANCQSCQSWDQHFGDDVEAQDDDNESWLSHALSFEKDRLGKDLTWKKKNEEELVVIDPREKEKSIREEQRAKKLTRMGGSSSAWDRDRHQGRAPDRRAGERAQ